MKRVWCSVLLTLPILVFLERWDFDFLGDTSREQKNIFNYHVITCSIVKPYWDHFSDEFVSLEWFSTIRMSSGKKLTAFDFKIFFIISWWLSKTSEKQQIRVKQPEEEHTCNRHLQKTRRACKSYSNDIEGEIEFLLIKKTSEMEW